MKLKFKIVSFLIVFISCNYLSSQTINIESINITRDNSSIDSGYSLNGFRMIDSRSKLLNPINFGMNGTYHKNVVINEQRNIRLLSSIKYFFQT